MGTPFDSDQPQAPARLTESWKIFSWRIQCSLKSGFKGALCSPPCTSDKPSERCGCSLNLVSGELQSGEAGLAASVAAGRNSRDLPPALLRLAAGWGQAWLPSSDTDALALGLWLLHCPQPPAPARSGLFYLCHEVVLPCTLASSAGAALELHRTVQRPFSCFRSSP